jgi:peroxiredoxin
MQSSRRVLTGFLTLSLVLFLGAPALADEIKPLKVGEEVPNFTLTDYNGKEHSLEKHEGKIVVITFTSQHCPWIHQGSDKQLAAIAEEYKEKDVVFLSVDAHAGTSMEDLKEYWAEKPQVPVLKDADQSYADALGATRTPELYVVDKDGKLAYQGAFDNRTRPNQTGEINYLTNALDALLNGEEIAQTHVQAWGCGIQRVG